MAMVQIQGFITSVYEPILEIFGNGEIITEAGQINLAVGLGNRIQFLRDRMPDASDKPEMIFTFKDDFDSLHHSSVVPGYLDTGRAEYVSNLVGNPVLSTSSVSSKNPGNLNVFFPGDSATNEFYFYLGDDTAKYFNWTNNSIQMATFVVAVMLDGGANAQFLWGFAQDGNALDGGTNSISISYFTVEANWQIQIAKSSVNSAVDTGVPVVIGEYITCRFILNGSDIDVEIDGVVTNTIPAANVPLGELTISGRFSTSIADAAPAIATTDFWFVTAKVPGTTRSGP